MNKKIQSLKNYGASRSALRLGFVPLTDCAPLVMAQELGLFKKFGRQVELSREPGRASIRDDANEPSGDKAAWILQRVRDSGLCPDPSAMSFASAKKIFRPDIFEKAAALRRPASDTTDVDFTKQYAVAA